MTYRKPVPVWRRRAWESVTAVGPRHDPYSRRRLNVKENDRTYSYVECALEQEEWVEIDGRRVPKVYNPLDLFALLTGMDPDSWRKAIYKRYEPDPYGSLAEYV